MNWGKIFGVIFAILFIFISFQTIKHDFYLGIQQIKSFTNAQNNLEISIVSLNKTNIVLSAINPLNLSITIYNITGNYVYLQKPYIIPPHDSKDIVLIVTNYSGLINNVSNKTETLTISLGILNTTIDEVQTL